MYWKTREKLEGADKIFLTLQDIQTKLCYQVRIKLPTSEYVLIELHQPFPDKPLYQSLNNGGFNHDPETDSILINFHQQETIKILNTSKGFRHNSSATIDTIISLIKNMRNF